jgi:hypothetical protein
MSEAAPAFIPRRGFVKRNQLSVDSAAFFASADATSQPFSRALITTELSTQRIYEQKQLLG